MNASRWSILRWLLDLGLLAGALALANLAKWNLGFGEEPEPGTRFVTPLIVALLLGVWSLFAQVTALYHPRRSSGPAQELERAVVTMALTVITLAGLFLLLRYYFFSRLLLVYLFWIAIFLMAASRLVLWKGWRLWRSRGYGGRRVIIVGDGEDAERLGRALQEEPWDSAQVLGLVTDKPSRTGLTVLGPIDQIQRIVVEHQADEVFVVEQERSAVVRVVETLQTLPVRVNVVPSYLELVSARASITVVGDIPLLELRAPAIDGIDALLKGALDLVVSAIAMVAMAPLMVVLALLVRLSSPGPVVFRQQRVGENGRVFTILKFRTMTLDAPPIVPVPEDPAELGQNRIKAPRDDRHITPIGRVLRRFALDELPQLFNVLRGEMSLVGPRPEVPPVVQMYTPRHLKRLAMKPGMTGPTQVRGTADLSLDERVTLELLYIQNYAVWEDVKLLVRTLAAVVTGKGVA